MKFENVKNVGQLRAALDEIFQDCWRQNEKRTRKMRTFLDFFRGYQHAVALGPNSEDPIDVDERVAFEVVQLVRPTLRQETASFLNTVPQMDPIPSMSGVVAAERARTTARMANSRMRCYPEYYNALYEARLSASIYGASWVKQTWDPYFVRNGKVVGDSDWKVLDLRDAIPDYRATREQDIRYMFHRRSVTREQAESWIPVDAEGNTTEGRFIAYNTRARVASGAELDRVYSKAASSVKNNELIEWVEAWLPPSIDMPEGGLVVYSGSMTLLVEDKLPDGIWPWTLINGLNKVPGKLYADGLMPDLVPIQITMNFLASKLRESTALSSQATLVTSRDAEIAEGAIDNIDGTVLEVNGDASRAVQWNQGPGPQPGVMNYSAVALEWWNRASTMVDASRGITNGQANAKLLSFQQELGDSTHAPDRIMWGNQVAKLMRNDVKLMYAHFDEGRYYRTIGPNNLPQTESFASSDFDPETDFLFDPLTSPPTNRELAEQKVLEAYQMGILDDVPAAKRARSMIRRFQDGSDTRDPKEMHRDRVRHEQVAYILRGQIPQVLDRDDDNVHLEEDETFTVSPEFLNSPLHLQEAYLQHMIVHQMNMNAKLNGQAVQSQMMDPAGAPAPGMPQVPTGGPEGGERTAESPASGGSSAYPDAVSSEDSAYQ